MEEHIKKGKASIPVTAITCARYLLLGRAHIEKNRAEVKDICNYFGIDPAAI
jgi:hypothetical protein